MEVVRRFRLSVVLSSLSVIAVMLVLATPFDKALAKGVLLGGVASCAAFWLSARSAEWTLSGNRSASYAIVGWTFIRLVVYAVVLGKAYSYDPDHWRGFFGAVAGLSVIYVMVALIGYTGWDLKRSLK